MEYGDIHRFLLRYVASRGVVGTTDAKQVLSVYTGLNEVTPLVDLVKRINEEIKPYQQSLKITNDEQTNDEVIVYLSLACDEVTKSQNLFTVNELEYFHLLLEEIMTTDSRQITGILAINLTNRMESLTKPDAQKLLDMWCKMHYLDKENDNYALGVRAINELEACVQLDLPDTIEECCLCKQNVYRGYNCPICAKAVHTKCIKQYLVKVRNWPCCKSDYNDDQLVQLNRDRSSITPSSIDTVNNLTSIATDDTVPQSSTSESDNTQQVGPSVSQRLTKRKRATP